MPLAAFHSFYWKEHPPVAGIVLTAASKYLGPPTLALLFVLLEPLLRLWL